MALSKLQQKLIRAWLDSSGVERIEGATFIVTGQNLLGASVIIKGAPIIVTKQTSGDIVGQAPPDVSGPAKALPFAVQRLIYLGLVVITIAICVGAFVMCLAWFLAMNPSWRPRLLS